MKVEGAANYLNMSQRTQTHSAGAGASFTDILAQKTKDTSSPATKAPSGEAATYDFTNMTPNELHDAVGGLIRSGQLDLDQTTSLLGLTSSLSPLSKVNYDGTAPYSDAPVNVFAALKTGIETAISRNERVSAEYMQKAADALTKLQGTPVQRQV